MIKKRLSNLAIVSSIIAISILIIQTNILSNYSEIWSVSGMFYGRLTIGFVALSVDTNPIYSYFAPLALEAWRRCDIEPVFVLVGNKISWESRPQSRLIIDYLRKAQAQIVHVDPEAFSRPFRPAFLSTVGRLFVPNVLALGDVLMMGDIDVLPFKSDYFKKMVKMLAFNQNMKMYMDKPTDLQIPRFSMCYIAGQVKNWLKVVPLADNVHDFLEIVLSPESIQDIYPNDEKQIATPSMNFDELYVGYHIQSLDCYPDCTSVTDKSFSRDYRSLVRGPPGPEYIWDKTLQASGKQTLRYLSQQIEGHVGEGPFSLYEDAKNPNGTLFSMIRLYWEIEPLNRVIEYSNKFFSHDMR